MRVLTNSPACITRFVQVRELYCNGQVDLATMLKHVDTGEPFLVRSPRPFSARPVVNPGGTYINEILMERTSPEE